MSNRTALLVIDGNYIVRTIYEAQPDGFIADRVENTRRSALQSMRRAVSSHRVSHAIAVFDFPGRNWRHDLYSGYKANRVPMPAELAAAIPRIREDLLTHLGVESISLPIVEADDVIAAVTLKWLQRKVGEAIVLSRDKDLLQLVAHGAHLHEHFRNEPRDAQWIRAKFNIEPDQIRDFLALTGDTSDSVPGVPGVGPKIAVRLLKTYGSLHGVLAHKAEIPGALGASLREHAAMAELSYELVRLEADLSLGLTWSKLALAPDTQQPAAPATQDVVQEDMFAER